MNVIHLRFPIISIIYYFIIVSGKKTISVQPLFVTMSENVEVQVEDEEFHLESDHELRFEVENKNETVVLEVRINSFLNLII